MPDQKLKLFSEEREPAAIKIMQRMSRIQAWVFKKSGGRLMRTFFFMSPVGILTCKGRKSGEWREVCLVYGEVDDKIVPQARGDGGPRSRGRGKDLPLGQDDGDLQRLR